MSVWSDIWDWITGRHRPKHTLIIPGTTATRFTGTAPAVKRSNNVIPFRPGAGAVIFAPQPAQVRRGTKRTPSPGGVTMTTTLPGVLNPVGIITNTTAMKFSGNMPYQILRVQSPAEGQLSVESDPPSLT